MHNLEQAAPFFERDTTSHKEDYEDLCQTLDDLTESLEEDQGDEDANGGTDEDDAEDD